MNFVNKLFKSAVCFICILGMVATFAAPSLADNCGNSDRVDLPSCVGGRRSEVLGQKSSTTWNLTNNCSFPVTIKFDKPSASDVLKTLNPKENVYEDGTLGTTVFCCPKYNRCS